MKKRMQEDQCVSFADAFYGSATVGERGQIVIPAEARAAIGFGPGDKVVIMRHPLHHGLMIFKVDAMREFLDEFSRKLAHVESKSQAADDDSEESQ